MTAFSVGATAQSQSSLNADVRKLCKVVLCHEPKQILLRLYGGKTFKVTPAVPTPIVTSSMVTILPGETVYVEARIEGDHLTDLTAVSKNVYPDRTLVFKFEQSAEIGDGTNMLLKVYSPFKGIIKYRLGTMAPGSDDIYKTSSCPLRGGHANFEHWVQPIFQLVAADFRFVSPDSKDASTCE